MKNSIVRICCVSVSLVILSLSYPSLAAARSTSPSRVTSSLASTCDFTPRGDYVHWSRTQPGYLHAHGSWVNGNCGATYALVTVRIQVYSSGAWRTRAERDKPVKSGGGSGNRTTASYGCGIYPLKARLWRSIVVVDPYVMGQEDPHKRYITPTRKLVCL